MLSVFNYSVKKLSNLESRFSNSDNSWKKNTSIILVETLRMVIYLSRNLLKTQSFFIVSNQKEMIFVLGKTGSRERKLLNLKKSSKTFTKDTKAISNYIYLLQHSVICLCPILWYQLNGSKRNPWVPVYLQSPIIQTTHLHCRLPCNYVTSLLAYCRG